MKKIGIYDSGCGGFTVIQHLLNTGFSGEIYYYGDTINNPWGNKTKLELRIILDTISEWFKSYNIDSIISGCNTTLSLFKDSLPDIFNQPVQNILENTEHHYTQNEYSVLSTENSCKNELFSHFLSKKIIQEIPCPNLANLIENNQITEAVSLANAFIKNSKYPTIILGCTHYPLIINQLKQEHPEKTFINPAKCLKIHPVITGSCPTIHFKTTGNESLFNLMINQHLQLNSYTINNMPNTTQASKKEYLKSIS